MNENRNKNIIIGVIVGVILAIIIVGIIIWYKNQNIKEEKVITEWPTTKEAEKELLNSLLPKVNPTKEEIKEKLEILDTMSAEARGNSTIQLSEEEQLKLLDTMSTKARESKE